MSPHPHAGPPEAPVRLRLLLVLVALFAFACLFGWLTKSMLDALGPKQPVQAASEHVSRPRDKKSKDATQTNARPVIANVAMEVPEDRKPAPRSTPVEPISSKQPSTPDVERDVTTTARTSDSAQALPSDTGEVTSITGHITLQGEPPPNPQVTFDPDCGKLNKQPVTVPLYVVSSEGDLADVFVFIREAPVGAKPPRRANPDPAMLYQVDCQYTPYVSAIQTGQTLLVRNYDPVLHNVHPIPSAEGNKESNRAQLPKAPDLAYQFQKPEVFLKFKCDVHNWMFAYVCVSESAAFDITDRHGIFHIPELPPGTYKLGAYHRKNGEIITKEVKVSKGEVTRVDFQFTVPSPLPQNPVAPRTARVP